MRVEGCRRMDGVSTWLEQNKSTQKRNKIKKTAQRVNEWSKRKNEDNLHGDEE